MMKSGLYVTVLAVGTIWRLMNPMCFAGEEGLIQPGTGVGVLKLGDPMSAAFGKLANTKADSAEEVVSEGRSEVWFKYGAMGITLIVDDQAKKILRIIVTSKGLILEKTGLHVGSTAAEVEKSYGPPDKKTKLDKNGSLWEYISSGVSFTINDAESRVDVITIMGRQ